MKNTLQFLLLKEKKYFFSHLAELTRKRIWIIIILNESTLFLAMPALFIFKVILFLYFKLKFKCSL